MTTAGIGATGRVGSEIIRGLLARGDAVTVLVRDHGKARRAFGEPDGLQDPPTLCRHHARRGRGCRPRCQCRRSPSLFAVKCLRIDPFD
jgi:hypothetical protein